MGSAYALFNGEDTTVYVHGDLIVKNVSYRDRLVHESKYLKKLLGVTGVPQFSWLKHNELAVSGIPRGVPLSMKKEIFLRNHGRDVFLQVAEIVCSAIKRDVFHGDLQPRNVIIDDDRRAFLIDFDCAYSSDSKSFCGPRYLCPLWFVRQNMKFKHPNDAQMLMVHQLFIFLYYFVVGEEFPDFINTAFEKLEFSQKLIHPKLKTLMTGFLELSESLPETVEKAASLISRVWSK